ncbi:recombinase family protein [Micromonospora maritima]|uniref:Recombinase family protein n=1 Tax=Micromonospora maritima TaxID=986711 RepID=A0ABW7ZJW6_9ACTN
MDLTDEGIPFGLDDQLRRMCGKADELGWDVWKVIKNPRLSAYKRRKITLPDGRREYRVFRPDLREALADLAAGRANALLCLDLDRAFRDPKDLQDLIDVVDHSPHDIVVESVTGSLHMEKGRDNFDAEIRVLVANKASRDTARRVAAARERQALNGQYGGGKRPFGFCSGPPKIVPDGGRTDEAVCAWHGGRDCRSGISPIKTETDVIANCSRRLLQGVSLRALAAELRDRDVPTVTGARWSAETLRDVLLRPRNAGLIVYRGEILDGVSAPWEPIVAPETFEAVRDLLTDPARQTAPGAPPRWVGTGVYRCGLCSPPGVETTRPVTCHVTRGGTNPRYTCREYNHVARNAHRTDEVVFAHVMYAITHPRAYELLAPAAPDVDAAALRTEKATLRQTLARMAEDEVLGLRTQEQVRAATRRANIRISEIDELLNVTVTDDPLAEVVNATDRVKAWKDMPVADKRVIVDRLCTVTILSARPGRRFDIASVRVDPKHSLGGTPAQFQADVR